MTATGLSPDRLAIELEQRAGALRPAEYVMRPDVLGAARLTRYSFSRTLLRRAAANSWSARCVRFEMNDAGEGEAVYEVEAEGQVFSFVAFTVTIDESEHTDRVIADRWEICAALIEGASSDEMLEFARREIPKQEAARLDPRFLTITRGNRSVRFFGYLVDSLAAGSQPDPDLVADAGYILRSTAFYGNGKYGMRSFGGYTSSHALSAPYRPQFLCAWLFRELGYDMVEHCARAIGGSQAVPFDDVWRHYFGLGNATGLGLVPYAFKHPRIMNAWAGLREIALADVRSLTGTPELLDRLGSWIDRARNHFGDGTDEDCGPFLSPADLVPVVDRISEQLRICRDEALPFDALYRWAEAESAETSELIVSLLVELHQLDDSSVDEMVAVEEYASADPTLTNADVARMIDERFTWLGELELDGEGGDHYWWLLSDNSEEPRRERRERLQPNGRDMAIDVALRVWRLRRDLAAVDDPESSIHTLLVEKPEHRLAFERVLVSDRLYGEPRDNVCAASYLPLQLQRFQLAMYGMDNFKPKSTDWLRVTLYQGAPRITDLASDMGDDWVLPRRPGRAK